MKGLYIPLSHFQLATQSKDNRRILLRPGAATFTEDHDAECNMQR